MSPTFRSLAIRNYRIYAAGALISNVGTWMQRVAQDWLVLQLTDNSGTALGITTGLQLLPALLISPYAGLVADRFPKRTVLSVTQIAMALPAALLGVLAITGVAVPWHVYVLAFAFGIATAFDAPARQSFVVEMVGPDDLSNAVGLNSASFNSGRMIGPAVAGVMIAALGSGAAATGWVIVINALSYLAVLYSLRILDTRELRPSEPADRGKGAVRDGIRYVRSRPDLMLLLATVFFVGTFGMNFQMTSALMATEVFHKGAGEYGLLGSIMAIGSLGGALLAARRPRPRQRLVVGAAVAFAFVEIASGLMPTYLTFAVILPLLGLTALTMVTSANATIQLSVDPQMRGRVSALYLMIFLGGTPLGAPFIGWIGEAFGARWTLIAGGLITLVGTLVALALFTRHTGLVVRPKLGRRPTWVVASRAEIIQARVRERELRAAANDAASN
ncbi:MFS transporter [Solicola gregarius]|uniref:MFS transporter n=1 Tax=Solicola gregarius TaxID=2908642 RepID=A0AA46TK14_9ACTN|nr:MFS transporter [Solicola gregarius]UYM06700.1 MFS transporter [Solicola gregarius]